MSREFLVVLVTASSREEGERIAQALVSERLSACVNVLGGIRSFYWWESKVEQADEVLLMCKARRNDFAALEKRVKELHSYTVPEVIGLPIREGSREYLEWLLRETDRGGGDP
jgi:periplasmic divalent cation tolerance protein